MTRQQIQDLIDQAERGKANTEIALEGFRNKTFTMMHNNVPVPHEVSIAEQERRVQNDNEWLVALRKMLAEMS